MLNLTLYERKVILFLISIGLIGIGISFAVKISPRAQRIVKVDVDMFKIDVNQASYEELLEAPGVRPSLAKRIIEYRESHGPFRGFEDLKEIKGIGEHRLEKLKEAFFIK